MAKKNCTQNSKSCKECGVIYQPTSNRQMYCDMCKLINTKRKRNALYRINKPKIDKYRAEVLGQKVGVGSGGNQGKGKTHHSYKTGIGNFRELAKSNKNPICERCGIELDYSKTYYYCVHHRDHDRSNNELSNLELLCKRCHQLEHDCVSKLPQYKS